MFKKANDQKYRAIMKCLNRLQNIKIYLKNDTNKAYAQEQVNLIIKDIKIINQFIQSDAEVHESLHKEVAKLKQNKENIMIKHKQELIKLQMLLYQNDLQNLKKKLNYFKSKDLDESSDLLQREYMCINKTQNSQLNKAFVFDQNSNYNSQNQFLCTFKSPSHKLNNTDRYKQALNIINNQTSPFQKKQQVWLDIVCSKKSSGLLDDSIPLPQDKKNIQKLRLKEQQSKISDFSQIINTEQYSHKRGQQNVLFSGKKIKSMIILKQKDKKKSISKTSTKKTNDNNNQLENIEIQFLSKSKKQLKFVSKFQQKQINKKKINAKSKSRSKDVKNVKKIIN